MRSSKRATLLASISPFFNLDQRKVLLLVLIVSVLKNEESSKGRLTAYRGKAGPAVLLDHFFQSAQVLLVLQRLPCPKLFKFFRFAPVFFLDLISLTTKRLIVLQHSL